MRSLITCAFFLGLAWTATPHCSANDDWERAAVKYRIQVYNTFRTDRDEYNRRREIGDRLLREHERLGRSPDGSVALAAWFAEAEALCLTTPAADLPATPDLTLFAVKSPEPQPAPQPPVEETASAQPAASEPATAPPPASDSAAAAPPASESAAAPPPASEPVTDATESAQAEPMLRAVGTSLWRAFTQ